jgi:hypothetical protein
MIEWTDTYFAFVTSRTRASSCIYPSQRSSASIPFLERSSMRCDQGIDGPIRVDRIAVVGCTSRREMRAGLPDEITRKAGRDCSSDRSVPWPNAKSKELTNLVEPCSVGRDLVRVYDTELLRSHMSMTRPSSTMSIPPG